jgi:hypothetical protein
LSNIFASPGGDKHARKKEKESKEKVVLPV